MKKQGFTLVEVLITLGIIGVVSALTIPTLILKHRKQVIETSLKKSYSILSQVLERSKAENGDAVNWDWSSYTASQRDSSEQFFQKYFYPYFNVVSRSKAYGQKKDLSYLIYSSIADKSENPSWTFNNGNNADWVELADGSVILFSFQYTGRHITYGSFHVILPSAKNKKQLIMGKDIFSFTIREYGDDIVISPFNYPTNWSCKYIDENKSTFLRACRGETTSDSGISPTSHCTSLIYCNNWKIPDDYPIRI